MQSLDEVRIAGMMGLSMDGPAAYLLGVIPREIWSIREFVIRDDKDAGTGGTFQVAAQPASAEHGEPQHGRSAAVRTAVLR